MSRASPPGPGTASRGAVRRSTREARLDVALAEREALRARGETPPLPDPTGRDRRDRVLRYVAYEDARRRQEAGIATDDEVAYLEARRAHLSAWRKQKNARRQRRAARRAEGADAPASSETTTTRPFPRLRGPDDLRALIEDRDVG